MIVVDGAAMVGTRKLGQLFDHAAAANAPKVVLIGDHHQLPEIDAGGTFAGIGIPVCRGRVSSENRRQIESSKNQHAPPSSTTADVDTAFTMYEATGSCRPHRRFQTTP